MCAVCTYASHVVQLDVTDPLFALKLPLWRMAAPVGQDSTKRIRVAADSCCHTAVRQSFGLLRIHPFETCLATALVHQ